MSKPSIFITGCSQGGIGDALAQEFASQGYHVFASVRNPSKAVHFDGNSSIEVIALDVTAPGSIENAVKQVNDRLSEGKLDVLVNNAGFGATGPLIEADIETAKAVYDVNVFGVLAVTQAFVPMLVKAKGKVVNLSSVGGLIAMPWGGLYHSSKAAATILSETLRLELGPLGVTVVTGMLGHIQSKFHDNDKWEGLPESSYYKSIEPQIAKSASSDVEAKMQKVEDFAKQFVKGVIGGASGQVWRGARAQTVRVLGYHAPMTFWDHMLLPRSGLSSLALGEDQGRR